MAGRHESPRKVTALERRLVSGDGSAGRPRTPVAAQRLPDTYRAFDREGLLAVLSNRVRFRVGFRLGAFRVGGETVGSLSDPS